MARPRLGITKKVSITLPEWAWTEIAGRTQPYPEFEFATVNDQLEVVGYSKARSQSDVLREYILSALGE